MHRKTGGRGLVSNLFDMRGRYSMVERGKYRGVRVNPKTGKPIEVPEAEHFYRCKVCGALVDCRDLGQVVRP